MSGIRGRGSKLRVQITGGYMNVPGCQDIQVNPPTVGTLDASDQDTLPGVLEILAGEPSEGSLEVAINFNPQEPTHVAIYNAMRAGTTMSWQVRIAGGGALRFAFTGVVRSFPVNLSKNELQRAQLSIGVGDFGALEADT